jgi:hypothetical protein
MLSSRVASSAGLRSGIASPQATWPGTCGGRNTIERRAARGERISPDLLIEVNPKMRRRRARRVQAGTRNHFGSAAERIRLCLDGAAGSARRLGDRTTLYPLMKVPHLRWKGQLAIVKEFNKGPSFLQTPK